MLAFYQKPTPMRKLISALSNFRKNFHKLDNEIRHAFIGAGIVLTILLIGAVVASFIEPRSVIVGGLLIAFLGGLIFIAWMIELVEKNVIRFIDKKLTSGKAVE